MCHLKDGFKQHVFGKAGFFGEVLVGSFEV